MPRPSISTRTSTPRARAAQRQQEDLACRVVVEDVAGQRDGPLRARDRREHRWISRIAILHYRDAVACQQRVAGQASTQVFQAGETWVA